MSGDQVLNGCAHLVGPVMVDLVGAIPRVQELLDQPVIVGGLAVMSRLNHAYRVTQDLDALRRRAAELCALTCSRPATPISTENSRTQLIAWRQWRTSGR